MDYTSKWEKIVEIGSGGQGKVFRVRSNKINEAANKIVSAIDYARDVYANPTLRSKMLILIKEAILEIDELNLPSNHGALKVLHKGENYDKAISRIKDEIKAMRTLKHSNLIEILDSNEEDWFVSKYYMGGTLDKNLGKYSGNFLETLKAIKPLVECIKLLHNEKIIHRDIKPHNIFIDEKDNLIIGDFGLIYFEDANRSRISETFESVGTTHWKPQWIMGQRIDKVTPKMDVYSLGKVIWSMLSAKPLLVREFFERTENSSLDIFSKSPGIKLANKLFRKCIVQEEKDCLPNAEELLEEIENLIFIIQQGLEGIPYGNLICKSCGIGIYNKITNNNDNMIEEFGFRRTSFAVDHRIYVCNKCGHVQIFSMSEGKKLKAWEN